jgi:hypothetical protein
MEALEHRLRKAEALLRAIAPDLSLDDPRFENCNAEQLVKALRKEMANTQARPGNTQAPPKTSSGAQPEGVAEGGEESLLETMVENSGSLDLDDQGHWDYRGHSSGVIFLRRLQERFGNLVPGLQSSTGSRSISQLLESPKSQSESPHDFTGPPTHDLPPRAVANVLCRNMFDHACVLMRCVHEPSFFSMFDRIYDTPPDQFTNEEHTFLPLLYVSLAVGCLFSDGMEGNLGLNGYRSAIDQG